MSTRHKHAVGDRPAKELPNQHIAVHPAAGDPASDPEVSGNPAPMSAGRPAAGSANGGAGSGAPATGHGVHSHAISTNADSRYLWTAFGLIVAFMAAEVVVGLAVGSLVLIADAAHMVSDAGAIGLTLFAMRLARRPARGAYTYGLKRAEILSALANGGGLLGLGLFFVVEG